MRAVAGLGAVLLLVAAGPAAAWASEPDQPHHQGLAEEAARRLPPAERDLLAAHLDELRAGAREPDVSMDPWYHTYRPSDGEGGAVQGTEESAERVRALLAGDDVAGAARELGILSHFILDVAQPMHAGPDDAIANPHHHAYETAAYVNRADLDLATSAPTMRADVEAVVLEVAEAGSTAYAPLAEALAAGEGNWTAEVANATEVPLRLGLQRVVDVFHTMLSAYVADAPARPEGDGPAEPPPVVRTASGVSVTAAAVALALATHLARRV